MSKKSLDERLAALEAAHPDMIWDWNTHTDCYTNTERVYIKCSCPLHYMLWPPTNSLEMTEHTLLDGIYTHRGAMCKVTELERMDWSKLDADAAAARLEQAQALREQNEIYEFANKPLTDEEYRSLLNGDR